MYLILSAFTSRQNQVFAVIIFSDRKYGLKCRINEGEIVYWHFETYLIYRKPTLNPTVFLAFRI